MNAKTPVGDDIRNQIALRAYFIWEREGRPDGREAEHWTLAEAEIKSELTVKKAATAKKTGKKAPITKANQKKAATPAKESAGIKPAVEAPAKAAVVTKPVKTKKAARAKKATAPKT